MTLDLSPNPRPEVAERVLLSTSDLFGSVRSWPLSARGGFPPVLRKNNFGLAAYATRTHAFLEITTKLRAQRNREAERLRAYRQVFTSAGSGEPAVFGVRARLLRFGGFTAEAPHAFSLGLDVSMCAWDIRSVAETTMGKQTHDIDLIYVVGFGQSIREADCWQEFETLVRITLSDWSGIR